MFHDADGVGGWVGEVARVCACDVLRCSEWALRKRLSKMK
jgi:hypothetical protein